MFYLTTTLAAIFVFFLIVLVHELGHFIVAKLVGVKVHEFAIGMGPKLFQFGRNETKYSLRVLPIGGYVKMEGEDDESRAEGSINNKPVLARIFVFAAGAIMNFALAIIIFIVIASLIGAPTTEIGDIAQDSPAYMAGIREGDILKAVNGEGISIWDEYEVIAEARKAKQYKMTVLRDNEEMDFIIEPAIKERRIIGIYPKIVDGVLTTVINVVPDDSPAKLAGIKPDDKIITINGNAINSWQDILDNINNSETEIIEIEIDRNGELLNFSVDSEIQQYQVIGLFSKVTNSITHGISYGMKRIVFLIGEMFNFLGRVARFENVSQEVGGPVKIISLVGQAARFGFLNLLQLAAFLSVNLGFLNLLPIPALDGGRILFGVVELVRGKQMDPEKEGLIHFIGFVVLILLIILVTFNDFIGLLF